ncbi:DUF2059 domain-containing protein [Thalassomonas sp. RHCl1]|uniref:DUF2059 domain-containing protein n=1 Tax=Thalassomonas sp. RHCl1 TaxID=2995320 RepID=UPI00248CCBED|nr:DUF2059 domain-containing protein [Thalassomonas sp. RHCl1]
MNKMFLSATFALALFAYPVNAESPSKKAAIEEVFVVMGMDKQIYGGFEAMMLTVEQQAARLQLNGEETEELKNIYRNWFEHDIDRVKIKAEMVELYAQTFSEKEIAELLTFYKSPTGQKLLEKSPELMKLGAQIGIEEGQLKQHLLIERVQPFIEKHTK